MTTEESERCFSTLKRIKTFLSNTMNVQYRLNPLALHGETADADIPDFNTKSLRGLLLRKTEEQSICSNKGCHSLTHKHTHSHTHTHTHTHKHTHTHTHSLTHSITQKTHTYTTQHLHTPIGTIYAPLPVFL